MAGRILVPVTTPSLTATGAVDADATLTYYVNGTTTLQSIYSAADLATPLANPLSPDAAGRFPEVWAPMGLTYSVKWSPTGASPITFDDITPLGDPGDVAYVSLSNSPTLAAAVAAAKATNVPLRKDAPISLTANTTLDVPGIIFADLEPIEMNGYTLTIAANWSIEGGMRPVFDFSGGGAFTVTEGAVGNRIYGEEFGMVGDWQSGSPTSYTDAKNPLNAAFGLVGHLWSETSSAFGGEIMLPNGQFGISARLTGPTGPFTLDGQNPTRSTLIQRYTEATATNGLIHVANGTNGALIRNIGLSAAQNGGAAISYNSTDTNSGGDINIENVRVGSATGTHSFAHGLYLSGAAHTGSAKGLRNCKIKNLQLFSASVSLATLDCLNNFGWLGGGAFDAGTGGANNIEIKSSDTVPSSYCQMELEYAHTIKWTAGTQKTYRWKTKVPYLVAMTFVSGPHENIHHEGDIETLTFTAGTYTKIVIDGNVDTLTFTAGTFSRVQINGSVGVLNFDGGTIDNLHIAGAVGTVAKTGTPTLSGCVIVGAVTNPIPISGLRYLSKVGFELEYTGDGQTGEFSFEGNGIAFEVSASTGDSCLVWASMNKTTITIMGANAQFGATASPGSGVFGITKAAPSSDIAIEGGADTDGITLTVTPYDGTLTAVTAPA